MADTTFQTVYPSLKAVDNGDGTYALAIYETAIAGTGVDTVFEDTLPPLKAVDNGDGTYSVAVVFV